MNNFKSDYDFLSVFQTFQNVVDFNNEFSYQLSTKLFKLLVYSQRQKEWDFEIFCTKNEWLSPKEICQVHYLQLFLCRRFRIPL